MDTISRLKNSIESIVSLTNDEFQLFCNSFELRTIEKNEFLLKEGKICTFIGLINQGALIYFKTIDNGNEITTDFAFEGDWVTSIHSRLTNTASTIHIKAIETTEILLIQQADLLDLYQRIPKLERLGRILMEQAYVKMVQHSMDLQIRTATERYENLILKYPELVQRVQLYHIANYLGIAPKSLSRIRKEIFD